MKKIAVFSSHLFEQSFLTDANKSGLDLIFIKQGLCRDTVSLCAGCAGIAVFTSDDVSSEVLSLLKEQGIEFVVTRSTGYDHIDIQKAGALNISVANVPGYSPNAIAEHAIALILALNRHLILSNNNVQHFNFTVDELIGFNLNGKTVGVVGTGEIGSVVCKILNGFGCHIIAHDIKENKFLIDNYGVKYVTFDSLCALSDIITLHVPLNADTKYLVDKKSIAMMKDGVMLINTSRGKLMKTGDLLEALDSGKISNLGTDVYENEKGIFFHDYSKTGIEDDMLKSLISHKNVLVSAHHAFLTKEALKNIADITIANIECFINKTINANSLTTNT